MGDVSAFGPGQKGNIKVFAAGTLAVDGTTCMKSGKQVTCSWTKEQGQDVLEFDSGIGSGSTKFVILPAEGLAAEPSTYVGVFEKKR